MLLSPLVARLISCIRFVMAERMELYAQNAKTLLRSRAIFQGTSLHTDKQLSAILRKLAAGESKQLADGCSYNDVVDHIRRADTASLAATIDKHLSRMRLAAMMAQSITDHRLRTGAEHNGTEAQAPITFAIADHKKEYQEALRRHNASAARAGRAADERETWKDLRWGCRLQELVGDFGVGALALTPAALRLRSGAIGLRDVGIAAYLAWRANLRADAPFERFARMMTLAV